MKRKITALLVTLCSAFAALGFASCEMIDSLQSNLGEMIQNQGKYEISIDTSEFSAVVAYNGSFQYEDISVIYKAANATGEFYETKLTAKPDMVVSGLDLTTVGEKELVLEYRGERFTVPYTVKYEVSFVTKAETFTQYALDVSEVEIPAVPESEGYTFAYWRSELPAVLEDNVTIEAHYYNDALSAPALEQLSVVYEPNATLADIEGLLPANANGRWEFIDNTLPVGEVGAHTYDVRFVPATDELAPVADSTVDIHVAKKQLVAPAFSAELTYTGALQRANVTHHESEEYRVYTVVNEGGIDAGEYFAVASLNDTDNYAWADGSIEPVVYAYSIAPKVLAFTVEETDLVYNREAQFPSYSLPVDVNVVESIARPVNAGTYNYTLTVDDPNYVGSYEGKFTIEPKEVEFVVATETFVYDGVTAFYPAYTFADAGDVPNVLRISGREETDAGSYSYAWMVVDDNYTGMHTGSYTVTKPEITVTAQGYEIVYPAKLPTIEYTVEGFENIDVLEITIPTPAVASAGTYTLTPVVGNPNVIAECISATLVIHKGTPEYYAPTLSTQDANGSMGIPAIYHDAISTVTFANEGFGSWTWKEPDTRIDSMESVSAVAIFTPQDPNLNPIERTFVIDKIDKRTVDVVITKDAYTYTGEEFTLEYKFVDRTDPEGYTVDADKLELSGNTPEINAGNYDKTLVIVSDCYRGSVSARISIAKATPDVALTPAGSSVAYSLDLTLASSGITLVGTAVRSGDGAAVSGSFAWVNSAFKLSELAIDAATPVEVRFTPTGEDENNYNPVVLTYTVTVVKAATTIQKSEGTGVKVDLEDTYTKVYDGKAFEFVPVVSRDDEPPASITCSYKNTATGEVTDSITKAGSYELTLTAAETARYLDVTQTVLVTITQAENAWTRSPELTPYTSWTYKTTASGIYMNASYGANTVVITYTNVTTGTVYENTLPLDAQAGSYEAYILLPETSDWTGLEETLTFTINKAGVARPTIEYTGIAYSGFAQKPTVNGTYADGSVNGVTYTVEYATPDSVNVGTYTVTVTLDDATNYVWLNTSDHVYEATYQITQAPNSIKSLTIEGWKYCEWTEANLPVATSDFGTPEFTYYTTQANAIGGTNAVTLDYIKTAAVKTYYVRADVAETENYDTAFTWIPFAISNADLENVDFSAEYEVIWNANLKLSDITLPDGYTWDAPDTPLEVDETGSTYKATFTKANYNPEQGEFKVIVNKATPKIEGLAEKYTKEYDGTAFTLPESVTHTNTDANATLTYTQYTNAGEYTVTVTLAETAHYEEAEAKFTLVIEKKANTQTISNMTVTYEQTTMEAMDGEGKTLADYNDEYGSWSWVRGDGTSVDGVGTYSYEAKYTPKSEYSANYAERTVSVSVTVKAKSIKAPTVSASLTYTGANQSATVTDVEPENNRPYTVDNAGGVNAGTYTATVILQDNYAWTEVSSAWKQSGNTLTYTYTIEKATLTVTVEASQTATYGDKVMEALALPTATFNGKPVGKWSWNNVTADTTVGTVGGTHYFEARYEFSSKEEEINFVKPSSIIQSIRVTVNKATPVINGLIDIDDSYTKVYDGNAFELTGVTHTNTDTNATLTYTQCTDAGEYTLTITLAATDNFKEVTVTRPLTITKATPTIEGLKTSYEMYYNGSAFELTGVSGTNPETDVEYEQVIEGGKHTVKVWLDETANYFGVSTTTTVTIKAIDNGWVEGYEPTMSAWTYGDAAPVLDIEALKAQLKSQNNGFDAGLTPVVTYTQGDTVYTNTIPTNAPAGVYTVAIKVAGNNNWNAFTAKEFTVTMEKKPITVPTLSVNDNEYTQAFSYDGTKKTSTLAASDYYSFENVSGTNVGTYTVKLTLNDENYKWSDGDETLTKELSFVIAQAQDIGLNDPTITGWTYLDTPNAPTATAVSFVPADKILFRYNAEISSTMAAGTYKVQAYVEGTTNYVGAESKWVEFIVAPKKAAADMIAALGGITTGVYDGSNQLADFFEAWNKNNEGYTYSLTATDFEGGEITENIGTNAGKYVIKLSAKENYALAEGDHEYTFEIEQQQVVANGIDVSFTYNGSAHTPTYAVYKVVDSEAPTAITGGYTDDRASDYVNAGNDYSFTVTLTDKNYKFADGVYTQNVSFVIAKATMDPVMYTVEGTFEWKEGLTPDTLGITLPDGYTWVDEAQALIPNDKEALSLEAKYNAPDGNYEETDATVIVKVIRAAVTLTIKPIEGSAPVYTGNAYTVRDLMSISDTHETFDENDYTVSWMVDGNLEATVTNAGTYSVGVTLAEGVSTYYNVSYDCTAVVVAKATPTAIVYGTAGEPVTAPEGWEWMIGNAPEYDEEGTYEVTANYTADDPNDNYTETGIVYIYIGKAAVSPEIEVSGNRYTGEELVIKVTVGELIPGTDENAQYTVACGEYAVAYSGNTATITVVDAGTYTITLTLTEHGLAGYSWTGTTASSIEETVTINAATNAISDLAITGWTYGENANEPSAMATFGEIKYTYSNAENGEYSETVPMTAGTYWVKATVAADGNNYAEVSKVTSFTIGKATPDVTIKTEYTATWSEGLTLGDITPTGSVSTGSYAWVDADGNEVATTTALNATTYSEWSILYTPEDTANYTTVTATATITVAPVEITADDITAIKAVDDQVYDYDGTQHVALTDGDGYTVAVAGTTFGGNAITTNIGTDAGNYTITLTAKANYVFADGVATSYGFTIDQAVVEATLTGEQLVYNGTEQTQTFTVGDLTAGTDYLTAGTDYTYSGYLATNASDTHAINIEITNPNYKFASGASTYLGYSIKQAENAWVSDDEKPKFVNADNVTVTEWTVGDDTPTLSWSVNNLKFTTVLEGSIKSSVKYVNTVTNAESSSIPTNAGSYKVVITVEGDTNWATFVDESLTFVIAPKPVGISISGAQDLTYNASAHEIDIFGEECGVAFTGDSGEDGKYSVTNAGTYTVTLTLKDSANYTWYDDETLNTILGEGNWSVAGDVLTYTFEVNKKKVEPKLDNNEFTYNGKAHTVNASVEDGVGFSISCDNGGTVNDAQISVTNAATYTVTFTLTDTNNYAWKDSNTLTITVKAAKDNELKTELSGATLTNGAASLTFGNTFSVSASTTYEDDVTVKYLDASGVELPEGTLPKDAGTYTIVITAAESANSNTPEKQTITLTIDPVEVGAADVALFNGLNTSYTYDRTNKLPKFTDGDHYTVSVTKNDAAVTEAIDAGEYTVVLTAEKNYAFKVGDEFVTKLEKTVTIDKAQVGTIQLESDEITYTGAAAVLSFTAKTMDESLILTAGTDYKLGATGTNVGNHKVVLTLSPNFRFGSGADTQELTYSIIPATVTVTMDQTSAVFAEGVTVERAITFAATTTLADGANIEFTVNGGEAVTAYTATGSNADTYTFEVKLVDKTNFKLQGADADGTVTVSFTIDRQGVASPFGELSSDIYTGEALISFASNVAYTITDANSNKVTSLTDAGTYELTATLTSNYKWNNTDSLEPISKPYTIKPAVATAEFTNPGEKLTYDGVGDTKAVTVEGVPKGLYEVSGNTWKDAGKYTVTVTLTGKNYTFATDGTSVTTKELTFNVNASKNYSVTTPAYDIDWAEDLTFTQDLASTVAAKYSATVSESALEGDFAWADGSIGTAINTIEQHSFTVEFKPTDPNYAATTHTVTVNVTKVKVTLTGTDQTITTTYSGNKYTIPAAAITATPTVELVYTPDRTMINAGTYTVTITLKDSEHYTLGDTPTVTVQIDRAKNEITNLTYDSNSNTFKIEAKYVPKDTTKITYKYREAGTEAWLDNPTKPGWYDVMVIIAETDNYNKVTSAPFTNAFNIEYQIVTHPSIENVVELTYNGSAQTVTIPAIDNTTITITDKDGIALEDGYTIDGNNVSVTNAGSYYVVYTRTDGAVWSDTGMKSDSNPIEFATMATGSTAWSVEPTIANAEKTTESGYTTFTYTYDKTVHAASAQAYLVGFEDVTFDAVVKYYSDADRKNEVSAPTNAGTYYVTFTVGDTDNYTGIAAVARLVINKAQVVLTTEDISGTIYYQNLLEFKKDNDGVVTGIDYDGATVFAADDYKAEANDSSIAGTFTINDDLTFVSQGNKDASTISYFTVSFTPNDTANYLGVAGQTVTVELKAVAYIGGTDYGTIENALRVNSGDVYVIPNTTGDVIIKESVTSNANLYLPYSGTTWASRGAGVEKATFADLNGSTKRTSWVKIADGVTLTLNGTLGIGGQIGSNINQVPSGNTYGNYAELLMMGTAKLISNGKVDCYGYIKEADKSGDYVTDGDSQTIFNGTVYMPFVVYDFKGGGHTSAYSSSGNGKTQDVSPFYVYDMPNIQSEMVFNYGSKLWGYAELYASDNTHTGAVQLLGTKAASANEPAVIYLTEREAQSIFKYTPEIAGRTTLNGTVTITMVGGAELAPMSMSVAGTTVNMKSVLFPISWKYDITVKDGEYTISTPIKLLSGSSFTVEEDATLNITSSFIVYPESVVNSIRKVAPYFTGTEDVLFGIASKDVYDQTKINATSLNNGVYDSWSLVRDYPGGLSAAQLLVKGVLNISKTATDNYGFGGFGGIVSVGSANARLNVTSSASNLTVTSQEYVKAGQWADIYLMDSITKSFEAPGNGTTYTSAGTYYGYTTDGTTFTWVPEGTKFDVSNYEFVLKGETEYTWDTTKIDYTMQQIVYGGSVSLAFATYSADKANGGVEYYIFKGWYDNENGEGDPIQTITWEEFAYGGKYYGKMIYGVFEYSATAYTANFTDESGVLANTTMAFGSLEGLDVMDNTAYMYKTQYNENYEYGKYLVGWSLTEGATAASSQADINAALQTAFEDETFITLYAVWADKYVVNFTVGDQGLNADDDNVVYLMESQIATFSADLYEYTEGMYAYNEVLEKSKYFNGWYIGDPGSPISKDNPFTKDNFTNKALTLTANWSDKAAFVFNVNNTDTGAGALPEIWAGFKKTLYLTPTQIEAGYPLTNYVSSDIMKYDMDISVKYEFNGWTTDQSGNEDFDALPSFEAVPETGYQLYAQWTNKHTIVLNANVPKDAVEAFTTEVSGWNGRSIYMSEGLLSLFDAKNPYIDSISTFAEDTTVNYYFAKWGATATGGEINFNTVDGTTTIYAQWLDKYWINIQINKPKEAETIDMFNGMSDTTEYLNDSQFGIFKTTYKSGYLASIMNINSYDVKKPYYFNGWLDKDNNAITDDTVNALAKGVTFVMNVNWVKKGKLTVNAEGSSSGRWPSTKVYNSAATVKITVGDLVHVNETLKSNWTTSWGALDKKDNDNGTYWLHPEQKYDVVALLGSGGASGYAFDAQGNPTTPTVTLTPVQGSPYSG